MTQTSNRFLDEMARLMEDATSVAEGVKREAEGAFRNQVERFVADMDLVRREEFDVVRDMASQARVENAELRKRVAELEKRLGIVPEGAAAPDEPATADTAVAEEGSADTAGTDPTEGKEPG